MPPQKPILTLNYCTQCHWLPRSTWMAQELLHTFADELGGVTLIPDTGGVFTITINGKTLWDRKTDGGFPEIKTLKQRVRDVIAPERDLGHSDSK